MYAENEKSCWECSFLYALVVLIYVCMRACSMLVYNAKLKKLLLRICLLLSAEYVYVYTYMCL